MKDPLNPNWKDKWKRKLKYTAIAIGLGTLIYHATQFNYNRKQLADFLYAPKEFREFKKYTGIKLKGFEDSLNIDETLKIAQILNHEKLAKKQLSEITIESENYDEKSNVGKIVEIMGFHGFANPVSNTITLNEFSSSLFIHELAHIKTYSKTSIFSKGEFLEEWEKIQEKSKYKYYTFEEKKSFYNSKIKKDTTLAKSIDLNQTSLDSSGYTSNYARTNKYEDISETVEKILYSIYNHDNIKKISPIIKEKIDLLIKYDLLPKETKEYIDLRTEYVNWHSLLVESKSDSASNIIIEKEKNARLEYIITSKKFIDKYKDSFVYNNVITDRATAIYTKFGKKENAIRAKSFDELKEALNYPERINYIEVLEKLKEIAALDYKKNPEKNPYIQAITEYNNRKNKFDMKLITYGITDKLIELKIIKEQ